MSDNPKCPDCEHTAAQHSSTCRFCNCIASDDAVRLVSAKARIVQLEATLKPFADELEIIGYFTYPEGKRPEAVKIWTRFLVGAAEALNRLPS